MPGNGGLILVEHGSQAHEECDHMAAYHMNAMPGI